MRTSILLSMMQWTYSIFSVSINAHVLNRGHVPKRFTPMSSDTGYATLLAHTTVLYFNLFQSSETISELHPKTQTSQMALTSPDSS